MAHNAISRRKFLRRGAGAVAAGALGIIGYTFGIEPHWVEIVKRSLPIRRLPAELEGCRLVQISDLHVGPRVAESYLVQCVQQVAGLAPDILVITGDLISYRSAEQFLQLRRVLGRLPGAPLGTLAVLGNHDYGRDWSEPAVAARVAEELAGAGVRVLRNEAEAIRGLSVVGLDDLWAHRFVPETPLAAIKESSACLVLCHNPDAVDRPGWGNYQGWVLAGHTHGGQCKPPFLPPPLLPVRNRRYTAGEIPLAGGRRLYINRGVGHLLSVRFNVRPEITVFTLTAQVAG